jgi:F-type H+-transporting ATPase subunit alpha
MAQYRELEAFAQFASDLDKNTQRALARGQRNVELLKQGLFHPQPVEEQVAAILAMNEGVFDDVEPAQVRTVEAKLVEYLRSHPSGVMDKLANGYVLTDEIRDLLLKASASFKEQFQASAK